MPERDAADIPTDDPRPDTLQRAPSLVLVNTGPGKGKTSAAIGVVVRAVARGWNVGVVQFLKSGTWKTGEERVCKQLGVDDVVRTITERPRDVNIVCTGRKAAPALIDVADTVSEVAEVKHAYKAGIRAKKGIDY